MSEFDLIREAFFAASPPIGPDTIVKNGDDASVHNVQEGMELVVSTDTSLAGVHWPLQLPLKRAADRAVCAALSDLAAMGAEARWVWVSAMIPDKNSAIQMGEGVNAALSRHGVELSGGDTVQSSETGLTVTVAGLTPRGKAMVRSEAKVGDTVWLLGLAGFASLGLKQWMAGMEEGYFKSYFAEIRPKLEQGIRLRDIGVRCCIDVSDGITADAGHICRASGIGMELELSHFPGWEKLCHKVGVENAQRAIAGGGDDYSLLFTAPSSLSWLDSMAKPIGICVEGESVLILLDGNPVEGLQAGYDHFA